MGSFASPPGGGQAAPWSIHALNSPISEGVNRSPFSGMTVSGTCPETRCIRGLPALSPGRMFGARLSPPFRAARGSSSRNPLFCFSGPWHWMQCASKIGRMSLAKSTDAGAAGGTRGGVTSAPTTDPAISSDGTRQWKIRDFNGLRKTKRNGGFKASPRRFASDRS